MNREPIIEFKNYSFQYYSQSEPTLHNIDLTIYRGEKILIVGPSGSGKSTLGHCLNGLIPFAYHGEYQGDLIVNGRSSHEQDIFEHSKIIGTVLQDSDGQFVGLTVGEDIAFALENDNVVHEELKERVQRVAEMVDMSSMLGASPFELSGGQKQRTALGGVLVDDVEVLLFDEPLANLDPLTGKAAIEIIDEIHKETSKTVIIIEHRLEDVLHRKIDRVIVMNNGRILEDMTPHELVSSKVLIDNGIREPLYITALKYAGIKVEPQMNPGYLWSLDLSGETEKLKTWHHSFEKTSAPVKKASIISMKDIHFAYDISKKIIRNVNVEIEEGEMLAIVGKNGAGKSTLSKLLAGFEKEDQGQILYLGEDMKDLTIKERAQRIGVVMQNPNQMISKALIYDEIALGLRLRNVDEAEIEKRVDHVLDICGLRPFKKWPIAALSYGQKKRVTIAAILVLDPRVIILDEPTAGQDFKHYTEIMEFLKEINAQGVTIILITHDMHLMLEYTSRSVVIADGTKIADASPAQILTDSQTIEKANLRETSLYYLAGLAGIEEGTQFVQNFIDFERSRR
ncbi:MULTISPECIES: ABC transporter ATP-binding protein [unclassified Fusibacter]|uniref:ABC transporter ATP-binding protein n=1 Tax=unclassified Fusibacter TaxID=2624464 RepID=UPI001010CF56|nr:MULTISPECIES: ABC transporter ATP-binding protein [unclassified Fusibacter]MCK8059681.1 ABC transporter ATP-binding protein [Fusibacter sp. A2]NPE21482.1 ABC transporter ATP-binding protein [Fusibacter sp. A1]RXV61893.1 ATP-binding cassette domain-containing protein [Fusibacter sp. A1]